MGGSRDHVIHNSADANSLITLSGGLEFLLENVERLIDELLAEFFDKATHAPESHLLQLCVRRLNDTKDLLDECLYDLAKDEKLVVYERLPDLTGLRFHSVDLIVPEYKHARED